MGEPRVWQVCEEAERHILWGVASRSWQREMRERRKREGDETTEEWRREKERETRDGKAGEQSKVKVGE